MTIPQLNDTMRAMMGAVARFYEHVDGSLVTAGSGNAFTIDTSSDHAAHADQSVIFARADRAPTGAATLKVDELAAKSIKINHNEDIGANTWAAGQMLCFVYDPTDDIYEVIGPSIPGDATITDPKFSTSVTPAPEGYLTLASGTPVITSDQASKTSIYYTPYKGNKLPLYNGTRFERETFSELTLALASEHLANNIYDVFAFDDGGTLRIGTGPTWTAGAVAGSITAGSCARGTGDASTELTRVQGFYVNANSLTLRNGGNTYAVDANKATYLGSLFIDGTNGQVTCHVSYGQDRKWGVWNAYNRNPIIVKAGDSTSTWNYTTNTVRASNNDSSNSITIFSGLAEEFYDFTFTQKILIQHGTVSTTAASNGIGFNSTSSMTGFVGYVSLDPASGTGNQHSTIIAQYIAVPSLGINVVTCLETAPNTASTVTWSGTETAMLLLAKWRG